MAAMFCLSLQSRDQGILPTRYTTNQFFDLAIEVSCMRMCSVWTFNTIHKRKFNTLLCVCWYQVGRSFLDSSLLYHNNKKKGTALYTELFYVNTYNSTNLKRYSARIMRLQLALLLSSWGGFFFPSTSESSKQDPKKRSGRRKHKNKKFFREEYNRPQTSTGNHRRKSRRDQTKTSLHSNNFVPRNDTNEMKGRYRRYDQEPELRRKKKRSNHIGFWHQWNLWKVS